eukprot:GFYU01017257.1.p1 GENE.GFYU01017257.1~~GFYU01017257.1.p1  ORF type:complete len:417 (-),score=89.29 GFYU01017257.1:37-1287(-)
MAYDPFREPGARHRGGMTVQQSNYLKNCWETETRAQTERSVREKQLKRFARQLRKRQFNEGEIKKISMHLLRNVEDDAIAMRLLDDGTGQPIGNDRPNNIGPRTEESQMFEVYVKNLCKLAKNRSTMSDIVPLSPQPAEPPERGGISPISPMAAGPGSRLPHLGHIRPNSQQSMRSIRTDSSLGSSILSPGSGVHKRQSPDKNNFTNQATAASQPSTGRSALNVVTLGDNINSGDPAQTSAARASTAGSKVSQRKRAHSAQGNEIIHNQPQLSPTRKTLSPLPGSTAFAQGLRQSGKARSLSPVVGVGAAGIGRTLETPDQTKHRVFSPPAYMRREREQFLTALKKSDVKDSFKLWRRINPGYLPVESPNSTMRREFHGEYDVSQIDHSKARVTGMFTDHLNNSIIKGFDIYATGH